MLSPAQSTDSDWTLGDRASRKFIATLLTITRCVEPNLERKKKKKKRNARRPRHVHGYELKKSVDENGGSSEDDSDTNGLYSSLDPNHHTLDLSS